MPEVLLFLDGATSVEDRECVVNGLNEAMEKLQIDATNRKRVAVRVVCVGRPFDTLLSIIGINACDQDLVYKKANEDLGRVVFDADWSPVSSLVNYAAAELLGCVYKGNRDGVFLITVVCTPPNMAAALCAGKISVAWPDELPMMNPNNIVTFSKSVPGTLAIALATTSLWTKALEWLHQYYLDE